MKLEWAINHFSDEMLKDLCELNGIPFKLIEDYRAEKFETRALEMDSDEFEDDAE